mmetsp:Transcript_30558/g.85596  ORF Transcript_30558/g.85596 Transcript_30558/m.85596 type:complete len:232 (+) Transcript_30558:807-1502(+)
MLLHVLRHVDAHDLLLVVEQLLCQRLGQLRLAHARGAQEHEGGDGLVGVGEARPAALHGVRDGVHGLLLPDHPLVQLVGQVQQLLALRLGQLLHGDARPACHDLSDVLLGHLLAQHAGAGPLLQLRLRLLQLLLQVVQGAVLELGGPVQVVLPLRLLHLDVDGVDLLAHLLDEVHVLLLRHPLVVERALLLLHPRELGLQGLEAALRRLVGGRPAPGEAQLLHLQLHDLAV